VYVSIYAPFKDRKDSILLRSRRLIAIKTCARNFQRTISHIFAACYRFESADPRILYRLQHGSSLGTSYVWMALARRNRR